jgi:filamentous hemagglutinin
MKPHDISGAVADQMGSPIPKRGGGYWDHAKEMQDTLRSLRKNAATLDGVVDPAAQAARQRALESIKTVEKALKGAGI